MSEKQQSDPRGSSAAPETPATRPKVAKVPFILNRINSDTDESEQTSDNDEEEDVEQKRRGYFQGFILELIHHDKLLRDL